MEQCTPRQYRYPSLLTSRKLPNRNVTPNNAVFHYFGSVSNDSNFAISVLQFLTEERRLLHQHRQKQGKTEPSYKLVDVVKVHISITSNPVKSRVKKLYQAKGPFIITNDLGQGLSEVRRYNFPDLKTRKYKSCILYLLPSYLSTQIISFRFINNIITAIF